MILQVRGGYTMQVLDELTINYGNEYLGTQGPGWRKCEGCRLEWDLYISGGNAIRVNQSGVLVMKCACCSNLVGGLGAEFFGQPMKDLNIFILQLFILTKGALTWLEVAAPTWPSAAEGGDLGIEVFSQSTDLEKH